MNLRLTMLPAGEGDALWLQWGPADDRRQMIVDMGVHATGRAWRSRVEALPVPQRKFDLLVVTHVDTDHIYGVLSALVDADPIEGFTFDDVWFNGWTHLGGGSVPPLAPREDLRTAALAHMFGSDLESYGGRQGEQLSIWLRQQPWNLAFQGGAVARPDDAVGPTIELAHGLKLTVLGPTRKQLAALKPAWRKAVAAALKKKTLDADEVDPELVPAGLEPMGRRKPRAPRLTSAAALEELANTTFDGDDTPANGSSIALLVEVEGNKLLLAGDAHAPELVSALTDLDPTGPLELCAFKLPHHGSQKNVSRELVEAVRCNHWLVSTNGVKHYHPDAAAIARVLHYGKPPAGAVDGPTLLFNEPSQFNGWWGQESWRRKFGYESHRGTEAAGLTLEIADGETRVVD